VPQLSLLAQHDSGSQIVGQGNCLFDTLSANYNGYEENIAKPPASKVKNATADSTELYLVGTIRPWPTMDEVACSTTKPDHY
jgi:hypothetical protein